MPRPGHDEWIGYSRITTPDGSKKAKCHICKKEMSNMSSTFLRKHRNNCSQAVSTNNGSKGTTVSASSSSTNANLSNMNFSSQTSRSLSDVTNVRNVTERNNQDLNNFDFEEIIETATDRQGNIDSQNSLVVSNANVISQSKMISPRTSVSAKNKKHLELDAALFMMFATLDLDFEIMISQPFTKFLSVVDNSYKPPKSDELESSVLSKIHMDFLGNQHELHLATLMGAIALQFGNNYFIVAFIIKKQKYFYVHSEEIPFDASIVDSTQCFLQKSAEKSFTRHKALVKFIIMQGNIVVDNELKWSTTIDGIVTDFDVKIYGSFYDTLDQICDKIHFVCQPNDKCVITCEKLKTKLKDSYYLGEAVNDFLDLYQESEPFKEVKAIIQEEIDHFLKPVALLSNFMDHRFKGKMFLDLHEYNIAMHTILYDMIPEEGIVALSLYRNNDEPFSRRTFENSETRYSVTKYWKLVKLEKVQVVDCNLEILSNFALQLSQLPSSVRSINLSSLQYIFNSKARDNDRLTEVIGCSVLNN